MSSLFLSFHLSKVQARIAFSSYLHRVQQRLLAESRVHTVSAWPDKDNDQMVKEIFKLLFFFFTNRSNRVPWGIISSVCASLIIILSLKHCCWNVRELFCGWSEWKHRVKTVSVTGKFSVFINIIRGFQENQRGVWISFYSVGLKSWTSLKTKNIFLFIYFFTCACSVHRS